MNITLETIKLLAILVASGTAIYGINSWRREARWKNKYQIAEQVLSLFYEARDIIKIIRHPNTTEEGKTREKGENESTEEARFRDSAHVATERFEKNSDVFNDLRKLKYRFMSLFGDEYRKPFDELDTIVSDILWACKQYWNIKFSHEKNSHYPDPTDRELEMMDEFKETFFSDWPNEDKIDKKIDKIVNEIEMICEKIIRENSSK